MSRTLIIIGLAIALLGVLWPIIKKLHLGQLPGDLIIKRSGFAFYLPITTCIVISLVISLILWLSNK